MNGGRGQGVGRCLNCRAALRGKVPTNCPRCSSVLLSLEPIPYDAFPHVFVRARQEARARVLEREGVSDPAASSAQLRSWWNQAWHEADWHDWGPLRQTGMAKQGSPLLVLVEHAPRKQRFKARPSPRYR